MFHLDREEYLDNAVAGQPTIPAYRCHACVRRIAGRAARDYRSPLRTLVRTRHVPRTACPQRPQDHSVCRSAAARASVLADATAVWCSSVWSARWRSFDGWPDLVSPPRIALQRSYVVTADTQNRFPISWNLSTPVSGQPRRVYSNVSDL